MKNYRLKAMRNIAGIIAIVAIIGLSFVACDNGGGGGGKSPTTPTTPGDPALSGTITISPSSGVTAGTELTATYSGSETVSYQWKKGSTNVGTNSNKYTPTEAGSYTVTVSATGFSSKTSAAVNVTTDETPSYEVSGNNFKFTDYQVYGDTMAALTGSTFAGAYPKYGDIGSSGKTLASDFTSPTCTIANGGKLTINLGVPNAAALDGLDSLSMESIASDSTAQIMAVLNFRNSAESVYLFLTKDNAGSGKTVIFVYADKPVTLNGAGFPSMTYSNVSLTTGWNMLLADRSGTPPYTLTKITTLDSTHKWVATDDL